MTPLPSPALPYPSPGTDGISLSAFDQDLIRALFPYLTNIVIRLNATLPKDGSEPMEGDLDMGGNDILNAGTVNAGTVVRGVNDSALVLTGGATHPNGANIELYGGSHATFPNHAYHDAALHHFRDVDASPTGLTIDPNNEVVLNVGRLRFPATPNPSTDPNTIDEYEEGTWTPTYVPTAGAFGAHTYASRSGHYTKVGRMVNIHFQIHLSNYVVGTASGQVTIQGLPFAQTITALIACPIWANSFTTAQPWPAGLLSNGVVNLYTPTSLATGPTAAFPVANFSNTAQLYGSGMYM